MISDSFVIKMMNSPYTVKSNKKRLPSAPSESLMTPVSTKRIYPKLFATPKTPQLVTVKQIPPHFNVSYNNAPTTRTTTFNPKYWTVFLRPDTFEHFSIIKKQRLPNPAIDLEKPKNTFPTLKKLKKCGNYLLSWQRGEDTNKTDYQIKGHIFPTIGGGIAVVFETKEKIRHKIDAF